MRPVRACMRRLVTTQPADAAKPVWQKHSCPCVHASHAHSSHAHSSHTHSSHAHSSHTHSRLRGEVAKWHAHVVPAHGESGKQGAHCLACAHTSGIFPSAAHRLVKHCSACLQLSFIAAAHCVPPPPPVGVQGCTCPHMHAHARMFACAHMQAHAHAHM